MSRVLFFIWIVLLAGCVSQGTVCDEPYVLVDGRCCLDQDQDNLCDDVSAKEDVISVIPSSTSTTLGKSVCGDGVCADDEAACCVDCGCGVLRICDSDLNKCVLSAEKVVEKSMENENVAYQIDVEYKMHLTYGEVGEQVMLSTESKMRMKETADGDVYFHMKILNNTEEFYVVDGVYYNNHPKYGWYKDEAKLAEWEDRLQNRNLSIQMIKKSRYSLINETERHIWVEITPDYIGAEEDIKELAMQSLEQRELFEDFKITKYSVAINKKTFNLDEEHIIFEASIGESKMVMEADAQNTYENVAVILPSQIRNVQDKPYELRIQDNYCRAIDPTIPEVRKKAAIEAAKKPGSFNLDQVINAYDFVHRNIKYISDPTTFKERLYPQMPNVTLDIMAGDCEDQAVLLASMLEAIGGTTSVVLSPGCEHAFLLLYVGEESGSYVSRTISRRYGLNTDEFVMQTGGWLILDPAGSYFPGGLHESCYHVGLETWRFVGGDDLLFVESCVDQPDNQVEEKIPERCSEHEECNNNAYLCISRRCEEARPDEPTYIGDIQAWVIGDNLYGYFYFRNSSNRSIVPEGRATIKIEAVTFDLDDNIEEKKKLYETLIDIKADDYEILSMAEKGAQKHREMAYLFQPIPLTTLAEHPWPPITQMSINFKNEERPYLIQSDTLFLLKETNKTMTLPTKGTHLLTDIIISARDVEAYGYVQQKVLGET